MTRRTGDTVLISGCYQHEALHRGPVVQRFWHSTKHQVVRQVLPPFPGEHVLDVGCGSGTVSAFLGSLGANVLGIDANAAAIDFASRTYGCGNVRFVRGLVDERFPVDQQVNKVYSLELIEHVYVEQARTMLTTFGRLLRPGGQVLLTTPNYRSYWPILERLMDLAHLAPRLSDDQHVEHYWGSKLRELAQSCRFDVERMGTTCVLAPWMAAISWRAAERLGEWEIRCPLRVGAILYAVLRKREAL